MKELEGKMSAKEQAMMNKLLDALKKIPRGEVRSYKDIALEIETGPRVVARLISRNPFPVTIPCHRVVKHSGEVGGYTHKGEMNVKKKIELLESEGVEIKNGKVVEF